MQVYLLNLKKIQNKCAAIPFQSLYDEIKVKKKSKNIKVNKIICLVE